MELRKTSENVNRTFDAEGNPEERVESASFEIRDDGGETIGHATVWPTHMSVSIPEIYGFDGIAGGEARLKEMFGISE